MRGRAEQQETMFQPHDPGTEGTQGPPDPATSAGGTRFRPRRF